MSRGADRRFTLRRCLGSGGFGEVYEATMTSPGGLDTAVAVKVLRADLAFPAEAIGRLRDEARTLARLDHPAIVRAFDVVQLEERWALITELVDGEDFDRCIEGSGRLSPRAVLQVIGQVADALDASSNAKGPDGLLGLVHRDVKPNNIRIGRHGQVKLLDFGIAWFAGADREAQTASDMMLGSLPYMAPERFVDRAQLSSSDLFSLGCCLYEGLSDERFNELGTLRTMSALALEQEDFDDHARERLGRLDVDPEVISLVTAMLSFDPDARPTARDTARRCEALADDARGPSLRIWCADHRWQDQVVERGSLDGRTLTEGGPPAPAPRRAPSDAAQPRIVPQARGTIDPSMDVRAGESVSEPSPPKRFDTPSAPPAFPSIPLGMAIRENLVSEADVATVLRDEDDAPVRKRIPKGDAAKPKPKSVPPAQEANPRLSAPLPQEEGGGSRIIQVVAVLGCLGISGLMVFSSLAAIGMGFYLTM